MKILLSTAALFVIVLSTNQIYAQSWNLTGNAGTNATANFIGTTDNKALKFRTNNAARMTISSAGKIGIGTTLPVFKLDVKGGSINTDSVYRIGGKTILSVKGTQNIFSGAFCGGANTIGSSNAAHGSGAFYSNTEGFNNTAIGADALFSNIAASNNTAVGSAALYYNTTGYVNCALGTQALYNNTEGFGNAALGMAALHDNTIGDDNTASGSYALTNNTEGSSNTASGNYALHFNTTGSLNTGIGDNANTSIGTLTYASVMGAGAVVNSNDKVRLGDAGVTVVEGQVAYSWPSDARFKENVKEDVKGLDFIMKLQPVSYNFNRLKYAQHVKQHLTPEREIKLAKQSENRSVGFIAQDVEKTIQQTGFTAFDAVHAPTNETDNYSVGYAEFVVPLVKAVQELNEELKMQNAELKSRIENLESILSDKTSLTHQLNNSLTSLDQNNPNPFSEKTIISYCIPQNAGQGAIKIYSLDGSELKSIPVSTKGFGKTEISGKSLSAGTYTYMLILDGKVVDSKQMVLTK